MSHKKAEPIAGHGSGELNGWDAIPWLRIGASGFIIKITGQAGWIVIACSQLPPDDLSLVAGLATSYEEPPGSSLCEFIGFEAVLWILWLRSGSLVAFGAAIHRAVEGRPAAPNGHQTPVDDKPTRACLVHIISVSSVRRVLEFEDTTMTRVAIAGTGGLAYWIAHFLSTETFHPFILLSRAPKPLLTAKGWQVAVVNYTDPNDLKYKLAGVDTVISTVTGSPQIGLIDAAAAVGVKRFAPAEFEGQPSLRPQADQLDRGKLAALARLQHYSAYGMQFTSFVCGILYDRFSPGGMAASGIGIGSGVAAEGDYVMDIRNLKAQIPRYNAAGQPVRICMTSAHDIGRFVVAAIDLDEWPRELRMRGERLTVLEVVAIAEQMRGRNFEHEEYDHVEQTLPWRLHYAEMAHNVKQQRQAHALIATMDGRYDFASANLNSLVNFQPLRFRDWLQVAWQGQI